MIENDPSDDPRLLGEWLTEAGLDLVLLRPHDGDALPADLDGYAAFVVLGGEQRVSPGPDGQLGAPWFRELQALLRKAVRAGVPTLGVCLGAQLLAAAHNGTVAPAAAGPEIGPRLVAKRDAADRDPLFAPLPMLPDVVQWHYDEITELPLGAILLATSTNYVNQAFRVGECAWGVQFHPEVDTAMIADWAATERRSTGRAGHQRGGGGRGRGRAVRRPVRGVAAGGRTVRRAGPGRVGQGPARAGAGRRARVAIAGPLIPR